MGNKKRNTSVKKERCDEGMSEKSAKNRENKVNK
jgi:hypothetical protein